MYRGDQVNYQTVFKCVHENSDEWHSKSLVRAQKPLRFSSLAQPTGYLFSPDLIPAADHPAVRALGTKACDQLRAWRLVDYLSKTERVELELVNKAIDQILAIPT